MPKKHRNTSCCWKNLVNSCIHIYGILDTYDKKNNKYTSFLNCNDQ